MDILDNLIQTAQISGTINIQCQFQGQWFVEHKSQKNQGIVHIVTSGKGYVKIANEPPRLMQAGDIIFFPRCEEHVFSHNLACENLNVAVQETQSGAFQFKHTGQGERELSLFCATFHYDPHAELIFNLPHMLFLHITQSQLSPLLQLLTSESQRFLTGSRSVIDALANVLLVKLIRAYLAQENHELTGTLNGWQDKRLRVLIQQIVATPQENWSVKRMTDIAHISRAQLMRLFKQKIAISPHAFVMKQRLQKAAMLLNRSADSILNIALATGFQSETHFGKAFKRYYGVQPSVYRKQKRLQN
ncbi:cupin domain-containing protein [Conservatibacter flavescens]|uniref:AraC family transcriptional regulator n=1 Tax=Conservatibacter flavescens TaxID=28161 RepID=A0A2M8S049_9PAST|nr:cupin domain-containing protein [Conservatibacter flavescens]PJG84486.1 AraC family transcriptional regulator [Conservatibacter flavescens]